MTFVKFKLNFISLLTLFVNQFKIHYMKKIKIKDFIKNFVFCRNLADVTVGENGILQLHYDSLEEDKNDLFNVIEPLMTNNLLWIGIIKYYIISIIRLIFLVS